MIDLRPQSAREAVLQRALHEHREMVRRLVIALSGQAVSTGGFLNERIEAAFHEGSKLMGEVEGNDFEAYLGTLLEKAEEL